MRQFHRLIAREAKAATRQEIISKAIEAKIVLQEAGLAEKLHKRGTYRRRRERRPMRGMLLHLDASTHEWIAGLCRGDRVPMACTFRANFAGRVSPRQHFLH